MTKKSLSLFGFRLPAKYSAGGLLLVIIVAVLSGGKILPPRQNNTSVMPTPIQTEARIIVDKEASTSATAYVTKVVDGDTITVLIDGIKETVRFIGIDTPEVVDPRKLVQCFGREASEKTKALLTNQTVTLVVDPTQGNRDKYNRLLRYVFLGDVNINQQLLQEGYAHEYTYRLPYAYQTEFTQAERAAREGKKGLWADGVCPVATVTPSSL